MSCAKRIMGLLDLAPKLNMEYKIRKDFQPAKFLIEQDAKRRAKVEKAAGKAFTDEEWLSYKYMTALKRENQ